MKPSDYILNLKQIADIYKSAQKPTPYVLKRSDDNKCFVFIGVEHSSDPAHTMFKSIKTEWDTFLAATNDAKRVVFTEGGVRPVAKTQREAIERYGEPGVLSFWAAQENIKVFTPEPKPEDELAELRKQFSIEEIELYYFVRQVNQWQRRPAASFEDYMRHYFQPKSKDIPDSNFDFTLDNIIIIYEQKIGLRFDKNSSGWFHTLSNPTLDEYVTQRVAAASSTYRDESIANKLVNTYQSGMSIYSIYGSSHVYAFEPVFKKYIQPS